MSSMIGNLVKMSIFGESHGPMIGVTLDGLPAGERVDMEAVQCQMARRAPGSDPTSTARREKDQPRILSGVLNEHTTGAPLCAVIENTNVRSVDYKDLSGLPRPSHADYPAHIHYNGYQDVQGGGHFSGRLTAPMVFAGAVCRQILLRRGIHIFGHVLSCGGVEDAPLDACNPDLGLYKRLTGEYFSVIDPKKKVQMQQVIAQAKADSDSVGGTIEVAVTSMPPGIGSPIFDGVENRLAAALFGIPAVKGVSFGAGFDFAAMTGKQANDAYAMQGEKVVTTTNHNGGLLGGLTTGMPLLVKTAVKPTPSIAAEQKTVNLQTHENTALVIRGRHDPCILPRALPVVEAVCAVVITDLLKEAGLF